MKIDRRKAAPIGFPVVLLLVIGGLLAGHSVERAAPKPVTARAALGDVERTVLVTGSQRRSAEQGGLSNRLSRLGVRSVLHQALGGVS